ncbi:MAG: GNAT family N-acetyltransferase [Actinobacteria bacterium]|nr:GNAT family N-acetyltransferase [Actinomycetota bacterium]MSV64494.1 GNAT family N-acetyltransferase [Actinomycetota bacterium]MSW26507.1 GNAT family N-acetyltransferase [Actinomycetota bacterium]MSW33562.1 GNAT family N-acetyltransferase [Actinomycetota bacterium]MSX30586.1 GNAT family N-acetyltransferase [Actinomycetota bacterium]
MTSQLPDGAGVNIRTLSGIKELNLARAILDEVWPGEDGTQITANLLQAMLHNGTYLAGAFFADEIIATAFAFPGVSESKELHLHSHMAAVKEKFRNRNIGSALKLHQKNWALEHGFKTITWTFDPLVRRNAKLNIIKLGVQVFDYFEDFYGDLPDALNAGDPTDRVMAHWDLIGNHSALVGAEGAAIALSIADGKPVEHEVNTPFVLCYLPEDIIEMRSSNSSLSLQWRLALRNQLKPRLANGWQIAGLTSDGAYILNQLQHVKH